MSRNGVLLEPTPAVGTSSWTSKIKKNLTHFDPNRSFRSHLFPTNAVVQTDRACPPEARAERAREKWPSGQAILHVLRSDCQQSSAHPSERNAS
jgi:hypothetical protein